MGDFTGMPSAATDPSAPVAPAGAATGAAPAVAGLRRKYPDIGDDERLLRYMFSGRQVDDMLAAQPMNTEYAGDKPVLRLVRELLARRRPGRIHVRRGDLEIGMAFSSQAGSRNG